VTPDKVGPGVILVRHGVIEDVVAETPEAATIVDLGSLVISPGIVDCHVHVNEPGRTEWEGFESATRAAAAGGVTTLVDMPLNSIPVTTSATALHAKLAASEKRCFVDVGFWGGVVPGNARDLPALVDAGVLGCKAFLVHSGIEEFPNTTEDDLLQAMPVLRDLGVPLLAHAEIDLGAPVFQVGCRSYRRYLESRPAAWEDAAIRLLVDLCRRTRCAVHVVHLSSASSLGTLRAAKEEGLPITVETCPHYLCLVAEDIPDGATHFKCAPPIRSRDNRESLWSALFEGVIDFVISDHSPCTPDLKLLEHGDFERAWGGIASLQLGLAAVWTEGLRRGADVVRLADWMSARPASLAGLGATKGRIQRGFDADFAVWDPDESFSLAAEQLFFRHKISPYVGRRLTGRIHQTILRGTVIYDGAGHPAGPVGRHLLGRGARSERGGA
jgi:allantoinase